MATIFFVTGNKGKFKEVEEYIGNIAPSITIKQQDFDIREVQSLNQEKVAMHKAGVAWDLIQKPLLIDDAGIFFDEYPLFPGVFTKYMFRALGFKGLAKVLGDNNKVIFRSFMVYADGNERVLFKGETRGHLKITGEEPDKDLPFDVVFFPEGHEKNYRALRELPDFEKVNYRFKALKKFVDWYQSKL